MCRTVALLVTFLAAMSWPPEIQVTDLRERTKLVILVFGDSGTGKAGQHRVGEAMHQICRERQCDLALMLGDNIYENGIEVIARSDANASYREILEQFREKFEAPSERLKRIPSFLVWGVVGNHDYRRNAVGAMITYSQFSLLWRMPAFHYEVPMLPEWIQIYGLNTDTDERRDLNGLQVEAAKRALCGEGRSDRWKFVFGHQPVYNSGHHKNDGNERRVRSLLLQPLLRGCGVHVYFAGHSHHQEHLTVRSFEQIIQGSAAKSKSSNRPVRDPDVRQHHFTKNFGFAVVEVDPERIRIDFYDVLNTKEKGDITPLAPGDVDQPYSWCGTRQDIGRPEATPGMCP